MGPARLLGKRPDRRLPPPRRDQARPRRDGRIPRRLRALPCVGVVKGEHKFLLYCQYCGYVADVSPQEQWDNIPVIGKLQIFTFVGMLESYGEILGDVPHSLHVYYPFKGNRPEILFDPYTSRSTTSRRHNHLGRHRVPPSYEV
jgi:hypothetical protein